MKTAPRTWIVALAALLSLIVLPVSAVNFTLTSSGDTHAVTPTASTGLDSGGLITLRSAIEAATATAGTHVISIPAGIGSTITLSLGQMTPGSAAVGNNITVNGPGKALLTINQTTINRVFFTGSGAVTFTLTNLTLNYTGPVGTFASGSGGAVSTGGNGSSTSLTNVAISNFTVSPSSGGAISDSSNAGPHTLTITNCSFTNNRAVTNGDAVNVNGDPTTTTVLISGSAFTEIPEETLRARKEAQYIFPARGLVRRP